MMSKSASFNLIWGTTLLADQVYESLPNAEKGTVIFTDNNPEKWGMTYHDRPVYPPEKAFEFLKTGAIGKVYMGVRVYNYQAIYSQIRASVGEGFEVKLYALNMDGEFELLDFSVGSKPILNYIELDAIRTCNLNCRGCFHFSNLETAPQIYTREALEKDFHRLSMLFESVRLIRVMGGEPLLNPHLTDLLAVINGFFPKTRLAVVSNGLLVSKISDELAEFMGGRVEFNISPYEVTMPLMDDIRRFCRDKGIKVITEANDRDSFLKRIALDKRSREMTDDYFRCCTMKGCTTLCKGRFYHCALEAYISTFNQKYGTEFPEDTGISIYEVKTGQEIIDYLSRPSALCRYCVEPVAVDWKVGKNKQDALLSDWIVE